MLLKYWCVNRIQYKLYVAINHFIVTEHDKSSKYKEKKLTTYSYRFAMEVAGNMLCRCGRYESDSKVLFYP